MGMRNSVLLRLARWGFCLWLCWQGVAGPWGWCDSAESGKSQPKPAAEEQPSSSPAKPGYSGERISLELKDADLKDFFRLIGGISGLNIVLDPDVEGSLTIFLKDVPWDQALDVVLENQGMGRHLSGNVLRIARLSTLEAEQQQQQRLAQARVAAAEMETRIHRPSFAKAAELSPILKKVLSLRGDIIVDERTNALVISDIPPRLEAMEALLSQLDRKVRQVEIEARVVAASRSFLQDIGIQWNALYGRQSRTRQQEESSSEAAFSRFPVLDAPAAGGEAGHGGGAPAAEPRPSNGGARQRAEPDCRPGDRLCSRHPHHRLRAQGERQAALEAQDPDPEQRGRGGEAGDSDSHPDHREQHRFGPLHRFRAAAHRDPADYPAGRHPAERGHRKFHSRFFPARSKGIPTVNTHQNHHHHSGEKRRHGGDRRNTHRQPPAQPNPGPRTGRNPDPGRPLPEPLPGPGNPGTAFLSFAEDSVGAENSRKGIREA